jgi:hypothetical protein
VGNKIGFEVGKIVKGKAVGVLDRVSVFITVGFEVDFEGIDVGDLDKIEVGFEVTFEVGFKVTFEVGFKVTFEVGLVVGFTVGTEVDLTKYFSQSDNQNKLNNDILMKRLSLRNHLFKTVIK